jgi:hypothetical protein
MRKILLLSTILLLSSWAMAQYSGSQSGSDQGMNGHGNMGGQTSMGGSQGSMGGQANTDSQASMGGQKTTVVGCLSGSDGNFTLTDQSGTAYQLSGGNTSKLTAHVGHTIAVTGMASNPNATPSGSMSAPADSHATLTVSSFRHVSPTCSSGGN